MPYCSAAGSRLLIPPLANCFRDGLLAVLLSGWQRIAHPYARQWLSQWFVRRIAQQLAGDCSFLQMSMA